MFPASLQGSCLATGRGDADPWDLVVQCCRRSEIEACFRANRPDLELRLNEPEIGVLHERNGDRKFRMPGAPTEDAERICRTLGLTWNRILFENSPPRKPRGTPRP